MGVCGPSCLLGFVHRRYSVVDMSCFLLQCGCASSSLWVLLDHIDIGNKAEDMYSCIVISRCLMMAKK
jgi:hypothetical protein